MTGPALAKRSSVDAFAKAQAGAVSRDQLRQLRVSGSAIRAHLAARRWQQLFTGVYAVFTGPVPYKTRVWGALLYAGDDAAASHETAAWLAGLLDEPPLIVHVTVSAHRRVRGQPGLRIHYSSRLSEQIHPARQPTQTRVEETVLDLVDGYSHVDDVVGLLTRVCQRRLTSAKRLREWAGRRKKLRWRALLTDVLSDVVAGVQSALERRFFRDVERAHGLPRGERNRPEGEPGRRRYRDVRYRKYVTLVELDGSAAHPAEDREVDRSRDNDAVEQEEAAPLRYGWAPVAGRPCQVAGQLARVLRRRGWKGRPRRCGPDCTLEFP